MKDYWYILVRNTLAGINSPAIKIVYDALPIHYILIVRQFIMFIISLFTVNFKSFSKDLKGLNLKDFLIIVFTSFCSAVSVALVMKAFDYVPITVFSLLEQSILLITSIVLGFVFLKEKFSFKVYFAVFLTLVGLWLILSEGNLLNFGVIPYKGIIILVIYALIGGLSGVFSVKVINKTETSNYLLMNMFLRLLFYLPLPFIFGRSFSDFLIPVSIGIFSLLIYSSISVYLVDFLSNKSVKAIGYTKTKMFIPLIPLSSSFISMIIFKDWFNVYQYLGMFIIIYGLYLIIKYK